MFPSRSGNLEISPAESLILVTQALLTFGVLLAGGFGVITSGRAIGGMRRVKTRFVCYLIIVVGVALLVAGIIR
jgi:hypothetical protein